MLDVLKKLNSPGRKEDLIYFLQSIVGRRAIQIEDVRTLCAHAPAGYQLYADYLVSYCACFGWLKCDEVISLCEDTCAVVDNAAEINRHMIETTVKILFENSIFSPEMFIYDVEKSKLLFRNELLPLPYAPIRNVLISQGFLLIERENGKTHFEVHPDYENLVARYNKRSAKTMTINQLKARLEANSIAGAKAEEFVLAYEKKRINNTGLREKIKQISDVDVGAGYDIVSFESNDSVSFDRFIEVKAVTRQLGFFWSKNELEIAKLKGEQYYLYLVDLSKIGMPEYNPVIIPNPAETIINSIDWLVEPESYHIKSVIM